MTPTDALTDALASARITSPPSNSDIVVEEQEGTKNLPHIPLEILQQIAIHLDRPSAFALALTCRSLRDAGETKLWKDLDITSGWDEPVDDRGFPIAEPDTAAWLALQSTTHDRCQAALRGLRSYPYRAECVRTVRIEPSDGHDQSTATGILELLTLLAPYITHLDLVPLPWGEDASPGPEDMTSAQLEVVSHVEFWAMMADLVPCKYKLGCPRLKVLRMGLPTSSDGLLPHAIRRLITVPTDPAEKARSITDYKKVVFSPLEELRVESSSSQWDGTPDGQGMYGTRLHKLHWAEANVPSLPTLRRITFGDLEDDTWADLQLQQILSHAPNIEALRLLAAWGDSGEQAQCWKAIAGKPKLKSLMLFSADGLDEDFIGRQELIGVEELVMDDAELDEQDELSWTTQKLPRAPKLERLVLITSRRPPASEYAELGVARPSKPVAAERLSTRFEQHLQEYPNLTSIQLHYDESVFPSLYRTTPSPDPACPHAEYQPARPGLSRTLGGEPEYFIPPSRWEAEGHRGMLIRSYPNPINPTATLYHIRALTRSMERVGETYLGMRRQWRDLSRYRGRTVPLHVLDRVYAAIGGRRDWETEAEVRGQRGIRVDDLSVWSALDEWRNGVDDDSDVESSDEEGDDDDDDDNGWEDEDGEDEDDSDEVDEDGADVEVLEGEGAGEHIGQGDDEGWETDSEDPLAL